MAHGPAHAGALAQGRRAEVSGRSRTNTAMHDCHAPVTAADPVKVVTQPEMRQAEPQRLGGDQLAHAADRATSAR